MKPGDAKILRNAGARVTEDVLRTLVLATHLLGVTRVLVMPHTDCRMASGSEPEIHQAIFEASGVDTRSMEIRTVTDQRAALELDLTRIRTYPLLPKGVEIVGGFYDVNTGKLDLI
jgi:carbonic anhydrase